MKWSSTKPFNNNLNMKSHCHLNHSLWLLVAAIYQKLISFSTTSVYSLMVIWWSRSWWFWLWADDNGSVDDEHDGGNDDDDEHKAGRVRGCFDQARFVTSTRYGRPLLLQTIASFKDEMCSQMWVTTLFKVGKNSWGFFIEMLGSGLTRIFIYLCWFNPRVRDISAIEETSKEKGG